MNHIFIQGSHSQSGNETFPDARVSFRSERVALLTPVIEAAGNKNSLRVRRPHGKIGTLLTIDPHEMGTELIVQPRVASLVEEIEILVAQQADGGQMLCFTVGGSRGRTAVDLAGFFAHDHSHLKRG